MSQPTSDRYTDVGPPEALDRSRDQFWINGWKAGKSGRNLSAFEPNQVFLNAGRARFLDIGFLTGAGSDGDGRGVMVADVTGDLQPDLLVRQSGGGPLRVDANRFPPAGRLVVSLRGTDSDRLGVGARVVARVGGRALARQLFPTNNFVTAQASQVRFGLGDARRVDLLRVHWPSGAIDELRSIPAGLHIRITEGQSAYEVIQRARSEPEPTERAELAHPPPDPSCVTP